MSLENKNEIFVDGGRGVYLGTIMPEKLEFGLKSEKRDFHLSKCG
jgi:hypothetical protein